MSLAAFNTSMTVPWIVRHYGPHMCVLKEVRIDAIAALLALRTASCYCEWAAKYCTASACFNHSLVKMASIYNLFPFVHLIILFKLSFPRKRKKPLGLSTTIIDKIQTQCEKCKIEYYKVKDGDGVELFPSYCFHLMLNYSQWKIFTSP